jgi:hypothetical protein
MRPIGVPHNQRLKFTAAAILVFRASTSSQAAPAGELGPYARREDPMDLPIPTLLCELVAAGVWPAEGSAVWAQYQRPLASPERVRKFAAEEKEIHLSSPPFHTIADEVASASVVVVNEFWKRYGALDEIIPEKALILGDFGLGSDAPIILNYAVDALDPPVFRLRWIPNQPNKWVQGARNFSEFVSLLGLVNGGA